MTGAISFLQDALKVCDSRKVCDGCPCEPLCKRKESLSVLPKDSLATLVGGVSAAARAISSESDDAKTVLVTRYNEESGWDGEPGKGGKQVRTVTDLRNGLSDSGSTCQTYCHGGAGRNDRFERPVCLERMPCRTVGFHKNIISLKRKSFKRDRGRGRGQLAIGKRLSQTDDPAAGQSGPDLLQDLLPGDRRVLCSGFYKRHVWKRIDMC